MRTLEQYCSDVSVPGAPLMISALKTSFCGMGAISEGSFAVVGAGVISSVEKVRTNNDERKGTGLARAVQARRRDISSSSSESGTHLTTSAPKFGQYFLTTVLLFHF